MSRTAGSGLRVSDALVADEIVSGTLGTGSRVDASSRAAGHRAAEMRRRDGFTLIEILIATAIMTLGLVGILALFPVAIRAGREVIEDSNAVVVAQSVAEAIRSGIRNNKGYTKRGDVYFLFQHDGVQDRVPSDPREVKTTADYFILLPTYGSKAKFGGSTERKARRAALKKAKTFVYPETDTNRNGRGDPKRADNDLGDYRYRVEIEGDEERIETIKVEQTYSLGNHLVPGHTPRRRGGGTPTYEDGVVDEPRALSDMMIDELAQYSYAFSIRPSYFDADVSASKAFQPAGQLFHVTVMVFRNFRAPVLDEPSPHLDSSQLKYQLEFEVAL